MDRLNAERIAINIRVVAKQGCGCKRQLSIFCCGCAIVYRNGGIVDGRDSDVHRCRGRPTVAVEDGVGKARGTVVVRVRGEHYVCTGEGYTTVDGALDRRNRERVAVHVRVIAQECHASNGQRRVFGRARKVVYGHGRVIDRADVDRDGVGGCIERTTGVLHGEIEACVIDSVSIRSGREREISSRNIGCRYNLSSGYRDTVQTQRSIDWQCIDAYSCKGLSSIGISKCKIAERQRQRRVFCCRHSRVGAIWGRIGTHKYTYGACSGAAISVADGVVDGGHATEV